MQNGLETLVAQAVLADDGLLLRLERDVDVVEERPGRAVNVQIERALMVRRAECAEPPSLATTRPAGQGLRAGKQLAHRAVGRQGGDQLLDRSCHPGRPRRPADPTIAGNT